MELMNISQISNLSDEGLTQYAHDLSEEKNMPLTLVYNALNELRKFDIRKPVQLYGYNTEATTVAAYIARNAASGKITIDFDSAITNFCAHMDSLVLLPLLHNEDTLKVTSGTISYVVVNRDTCNKLKESSEGGFTHFIGRALSEYINFTEHFKNSPEDICISRGIIRLLQYLQFLGLRDMSERESKVIPENSSSITMDESTTRFSSALWFKAIQNKVIVLAGIGGIGRFGNLINF